MTRKTVANSNPGNADVVGGDDWDSLIGDLARGPWPYNYGIIKSGSDYHQVSNTGESISNNTDAGIILNDTVADLPITGGKIVFGEGTFDCDTAWLIDKTAVQISGQGRATKIDFTPAGATTNAIFFDGSVPAAGINDAKLRDFWIKANTNVTNIIRINGNSQRGEISGCLIDGTTKTAGHKGIFVDGTTPAAYYWNIFNDHILSEDIGVHLGPTEANSLFTYNLNFAGCNIGIDIDNVDLNLMSNIWGQSLTTCVVRLRTAAVYNGLTNIIGESNTGPIVVIESGCKFNRIVNVINSGSGGRITDSSGEKNFLMPGLLITNHADLTVGASPYDYTNVDGYPETCYIRGGIVTNISVKRETITQTIATDTDKSVLLNAGDHLILTYNVTPTVTVIPSG